MRHVNRTLPFLILVPLVCLSILNPTAPSRAAVGHPITHRQADGKKYVCPACGLTCDKLEFDHPGTCPICPLATSDNGFAGEVDYEE